jgi:hypothetical protein
MRYQIYKPNSKNTGCAMSFSFAKSRGKYAFYANAIKQFSWDTQKKTGSFSQNSKNPEKSISCKFSPSELGEILSCVKNKTGWSSVHVYNDNKTVISVTPWERESKVGFGNNEQKFNTFWFGFSISKNGGERFSCPLSPGEAEALCVLIENFLAENMKEAHKDYYDNANSGSGRSSDQFNDEDDSNELPDF